MLPSEFWYTPPTDAGQGYDVLVLTALEIVELVPVAMVEEEAEIAVAALLIDSVLIEGPDGV